MSFKCEIVTFKMKRFLSNDLERLHTSVFGKYKTARYFFSYRAGFTSDFFP